MDKNQTIPRMRTVAAAAAETGLAVFHVRKLVAEHKIRYVRAGRKVLVNLDSLVRYLNVGEGATDDDT